MMHIECYRRFILEKYDYVHPDPLQRELPSNLWTHIACSKHCHDQYVQKVERLNQESYVFPYDEDGPKGKYDPISSLSIILDWMSTGDNLKEYLGHNVEGKTKLDYAKEVNEMIQRAGCRQVRRAHDVRQKIDNLIASYKRASEWSKQTGQGLLDKGEVASFQDGLRQFCVHWDLLDPILRTRSGVVALFNSDDADLIAPPKKTSNTSSHPEPDDSDDDVEYLVETFLGDDAAVIPGGTILQPIPVDDATTANDAQPKTPTNPTQNPVASTTVNKDVVSKPKKKKRLTSLDVFGRGSSKNSKVLAKYGPWFENTYKESGEARNKELLMKSDRNELLRHQIDIENQVYQIRTEELSLRRKAEERAEERDRVALDQQQTAFFHQLRREYKYSHKKIRRNYPYLAHIVDADLASESSDSEA